MDFKILQNIAAHPIINASPPKGVIAPNFVIPVRDSAYNEPEKITIPAMNPYPEMVKALC